MTVVPHHKADPATLFDAENFGLLAGQAGEPMTSCPGKMTDEFKVSWLKGWVKGAKYERV